MRDPREEERIEIYMGGSSAEMLAIEYLGLRDLLHDLTERQARTLPADHLPTVVALVSALAVELLPLGPAPSLSDALDALDQVYAAWQAEAPPFQRLQARTLAHAAGQLSILRHLLLPEN